MKKEGGEGGKRRKKFERVVDSSAVIRARI